MKIFLTSLACVLSFVAAAQAQSASAYCRVEATLEALVKKAEPKVIIAETKKKCRAGETIQLPEGSYVTAVLCDFSKQIIPGHGMALTVCVYGGDRTER